MCIAVHLGRFLSLTLLALIVTLWRLQADIHTWVFNNDVFYYFFSAINNILVIEQTRSMVIGHKVRPEYGDMIYIACCDC